jgi:hypothetical protein
MIRPQILRQLKDIQNQGDKLIKGSPSMSDIRDFARYSSEIQNYLHSLEIDPAIRNLICDIPDVTLDDLSPITGIWALLPSVFSYWFIERSRIEQALTIVSIAVGKYASVEFLLKNYLEE